MRGRALGAVLLAIAGSGIACDLGDGSDDPAAGALGTDDLSEDHDETAPDEEARDVIAAGNQLITISS